MAPTPKRPANATPQPMEGIFYVIRHPDGWQLHPFIAASDSSLGHMEFWETSLARLVAEAWGPCHPDGADGLELLLAAYCYAFPRGRVVNQSGRAVIYHGNDLIPAMKITRRQIEQAFGLRKPARWISDDHERCLQEEKEAVRALLRIPETWPAAE